MSVALTPTRPMSMRQSGRNSRQAITASTVRKPVKRKTRSDTAMIREAKISVLKIVVDAAVEMLAGDRPGHIPGLLPRTADEHGFPVPVSGRVMARISEISAAPSS